MAYIKSIVVLTEILVFIFCIKIHLWERGYGISEALCFSILLCLSFYSVTIQLFLLLGIAKLFFLTDLAVLLFCMHTLSSKGKARARVMKRVKEFTKGHREYLLFFAPVYIYLFAQALLLPPQNFDSMTYNLSRVLMMIEENRLFPLNHSTQRQVAFPPGFDVLHFLFLRFHSDLFLPLFSFLSYAAVVSGIYALTGKIRELRNRPLLPLAVALIVSALKLLTLQATTTKNDIGTAAAAVAAMVACRKAVEERDVRSFPILFTALVAGMSFKGYFAGFALPFIILSIPLFIGAGSKQKAVPSSPRLRLLMVLPISGLLLLLVFFAHNILNFGGPFGDREFVRLHTNPDGLLGGMLNAGRYIAQSLEFPTFLGGNILDQLHAGLPGKLPTLGALGQVRLSSFRMPAENVSWAGPIGFFIILPALLFAPMRARGFIRLSALSAWCFFFMICCKLTWTQWSSRFFCLFFASGGIATGFLIRNFSLGAIRSLLLISFTVLLFSTLFNVSKPFFNMREIGYLVHTRIAPVGSFWEKSKPGFRYPGPLLFNWFQRVTDRTAHYNDYFEFDVVETYRSLIPENASVLILAGNDTWVFPFLLHGKKLRKVVASPERIVMCGKTLDMNNESHRRIVYDSFDYMILAGVPGYEELVPRKPLFAHHARNRGDAAFYLFRLSHP